MCPSLSAAAPMKVGTSPLGSRSGPTRPVSGGVHAQLEADKWNARTKAVGQGNSVRLSRA